MNQVPLTAAGAERLKEELNELKFVKRPQIIEAIAVARDHGDLKENAEYHAAREEQGFIEGRIAELESVLSNAQIIDVSKLNQTGRVVFGCTVDLIDVETQEQVTYQELQEMFMDNLPDDSSLFNEFHALIVETGKDFCRKKPLCDKCPLSR